MKVAVIFSVAFAVLLNTAYSKDFQLKVKNAITDKDESDAINVDENRGTETVNTSDGHLSMKDFNTGFTAIKNTETKECLIITTDNTGDQTSVADLEKDLEAIEGSKKQPEVVQEAVQDIDNTTDITDEQRTAVGQNLIDFCDDFRIVVGSTEDDSEDGVPEGELEEADEDESEEETSKGESSEASGRKKRALCRRRRLYLQRVCLRRRYRLRYRVCSRRFLGRCISYRYIYRYVYRSYCYNRYFWRYYIYRC